MICDFTLTLKDYEGNPMKEKDIPITLGWVARECLSIPVEKEDSDTKLKKYRLCMKTIDTPVNEYSVEELAMIKAAIGKHPMPLIVGQSFDMIEGFGK